MIDVTAAGDVNVPAPSGFAASAFASGVNCPTGLHPIADL
jgi:hypothetical protein